MNKNFQLFMVKQFGQLLIRNSNKGIMDVTGYEMSMNSTTFNLGFIVDGKCYNFPLTVSRLMAIQVSQYWRLMDKYSHMARLLAADAAKYIDYSEEVEVATVELDNESIVVINETTFKVNSKDEVLDTLMVAGVNISEVASTFEVDQCMPEVIEVNEVAYTFHSDLSLRVNAALEHLDTITGNNYPWTATITDTGSGVHVECSLTVYGILFKREGVILMKDILNGTFEGYTHEMFDFKGYKF
ncbi:hypothetical protein [Photobacterium phosphoreum]|uniref:hypothetical protein n=1 Tax=Photobacterium phosphoreum TaxID=659 RepID=UPI0024B9B49E|nr:hypothetical protein [Photobacterium phosphoreum]